MRRSIIAISFSLTLLFLPSFVLAAPGPYLKSLYASRPDLQALFDAKTFQAKPAAETAAVNLEDWARQYGWRKDKKLGFYKPKGTVPVAVGNGTPPTVSADNYIVIDQATGLILLEQHAGAVKRLASLTKLMTVDIVMSRKVPLGRLQAITAADQVGGSRLGVAAGTKFTVDDLLY